jgi:hypothetical protein
VINITVMIISRFIERFARLPGYVGGK